MDYDKIGKFISERRKKVNLTQKMLAEKLNITDRAVSRWERGKGCPDISLLEPLSEILDVSILELLHGENNIENENEVVMEILKKNENKIKIWKIITFVLLNIFMILFLYLFSCYFLLPKIISNQEDTFYLNSTTGYNDNLYKKEDIVIFEKKNIEEAEIGDIILFDYNNYKYAYKVLNKKYDKDGNILLGIDFKENGLLVIKTNTGTNSDNQDEYFYVDSEHFFGVEKNPARVLSFLIRNKNWNPYLEMDVYCNAFFIFLGLGAIAIIILDIDQLYKMRCNI